MNDPTEQPNPLLAAMPDDPRERLLLALEKLRLGWLDHEVEPHPVPIIASEPDLPRRTWLPEPEWMTGQTAFNILKLQCLGSAKTLSKICQLISDQFDWLENGANYAIDRMPPNYELLAPFKIGTNQWFRALWTVLTTYQGEEIEGWVEYVEEIEEWATWLDHLRLRPRDVLQTALSVDWTYIDISLPEAKQNPIWSFPHAMAWVATRDYLALARLGHFYQSSNEEEQYAIDGVSRHATGALGWLHTALAFAKCQCGALEDYRWEAPRHCTCLSMAWEEIVRFSGGLTDQTPALVYNLEEGWISMTWPEGADRIRFVRRDILDRWPADPLATFDKPAIEHSTASGETDCRIWLAKQFAGDPERRRSKSDFRAAALAEFAGRLSERGFNLRVWPELARENGRDGAGAKRKS